MATNGTFETWQAQVNAILIRKCGMGIEDLPDYGYWDCWHAGSTPTETAADALEYAKEF